MTAASEPIPVRVAVTDSWDHVVLTIGPQETIGDLKRRALTRTVGRRAAPDEYVVKYRGGLVLDESVTPAALGAPPNAAFIVLPVRRRPVR